MLVLAVCYVRNYTFTRQQKIQTRSQNENVWFILQSFIPDKNFRLFIIHKILQSGVDSMQGPPKVVFYLRRSASVGCLPTKVVSHRKLSFSFGRLPQKVFFQQRSSSTDGHLSPKDVFHQRSCSTEGRLPPRVAFHRRSSSTKGNLQSKVVLH